MRDITIPLARYAEFADDLDRLETLHLWAAFAEREKIRDALAAGLTLTEHQAATLAAADDAFAAAARELCALMEADDWLADLPPDHYVRQFYADHQGDAS